MTEKDSEDYRLMKDRYTELKVILNSFGINLTDIDQTTDSILQYFANCPYIK